jgi:hypothetical protein
MSGSNPVSAEQLTAAERLSEIAEILSVGLIRLHARKSTQLSRRRGESFLDFAAHPSGDANAFSNGKSSA